MQSHPTNNTKLYCSSQLLHQHSERSRQQHDFSSMATAWQRIPTHPNPSHGSAWALGSLWGGMRSSFPPFPMPERDRNSGGFCGGSPGLGWHKKEGSPWPGRPLGPRLGGGVGKGRPQPGLALSRAGAATVTQCPKPGAPTSISYPWLFQLPWGRDEPPPHPMGNLQNLTTC